MGKMDEMESKINQKGIKWIGLLWYSPSYMGGIITTLKSKRCHSIPLSFSF
jgi:hypothetical protein